MALNAIDGMLAREHGQKSALGGILNELGDVVSDAAILGDDDRPIPPGAQLCSEFALAGRDHVLSPQQLGPDLAHRGRR